MLSTERCLACIKKNKDALETSIHERKVEVNSRKLVRTKSHVDLWSCCKIFGFFSE
jgi:hypothetical protein